MRDSSDQANDATIREYYASMALIGLLANLHHAHRPMEPKQVAGLAFAIADAMLAEAAKEPPK